MTDSVERARHSETAGSSSERANRGLRVRRPGQKAMQGIRFQCVVNALPPIAKSVISGVRIEAYGTRISKNTFQSEM